MRMLPLLLALALVPAAPLAAGDPPGRAALARAVERLGHDDAAVRQAAFRTVHRLFREQMAPLITGLRSGDPEIARVCRKVLEGPLPERAREAPAQTAEQAIVVGGLGGLQANGNVRIRIVQNGALRIVQPAQDDEVAARVGAFGLWGEPLRDPALRDQLRLAAGRGYLVRRVEPDSPAGRLGVQPHDLLLRVDGKPVLAEEDVAAALGEKRPAWGWIRIRVLRRGELVDLPAKPDKEGAEAGAGGAAK